MKNFACAVWMLGFPIVLDYLLRNAEGLTAASGTLKGSSFFIWFLVGVMLLDDAPGPKPTK